MANYNFTILDLFSKFKPFLYTTQEGYTYINIDADNILDDYPQLANHISREPQNLNDLVRDFDFSKLIPIVVKALQEIHLQNISHWSITNVNDEDRQLTGNEGIVSVYATADRTITLPSDSQQGDTYIFIRENGSSANVIIDGGGFKIRWEGNNSNTYTLSKENESVKIIGINGEIEVGWYVI